MKFKTIKLLALAALSLGLAASASAQARINVLFLGSLSQIGLNDTFSDIMRRDARFDVVNSDTLEWTASNLPTLATLNQYDAVLAWTDFEFSVNMSNLLADYVDAGGGVVLGTFWGQQVDFLAGGGRLETSGYNPLINAHSDFDTIFSPATLGTYDATSPIFSNVDNLSADQFRGDYFPGLDVGATLIASWSDGNPLLAYNAARSVINISLNPAVSTYGHASGDYARLFRNSLAFVGNNSTPPPTTAVPEPSTYALFGTALIGLVVIRRRFAKKV